MINHRVDDPDAIVDPMRRRGPWIDPRSPESAFGRFARVGDLHGNHIELWEPSRRR
ncbi:MAG: VOC family protein [Thermoplasmata archaeon]